MSKILIILVFIQFIPSSDLTTRQNRRLEKLVEKVWDTDVEYLLIEEMSGDYFQYEGDVLIRIKENQKVLGYVAGREIRDNYLHYFPVFAFSSSGEVLRAYVLEMNTLKGSEINTRYWLKQFIGYHGGDLSYGKDIQAISGATLSGLSMVKEVQYYQQVILLASGIKSGGE